MSRDIQYIGRDVHQEAVVMAVLNSSGKLAMESIVETKAICRHSHVRYWSAWVAALHGSQFRKNNWRCSQETSDS